MVRMGGTVEHGGPQLTIASLRENEAAKGVACGYARPSGVGLPQSRQMPSGGPWRAASESLPGLARVRAVGFCTL